MSYSLDENPPILLFTIREDILPHYATVSTTLVREGGVEQGSILNDAIIVAVFATGDDLLKSLARQITPRIDTRGLGSNVIIIPGLVLISQFNLDIRKVGVLVKRIVKFTNMVYDKNIEGCHTCYSFMTSISVLRISCVFCSNTYN